MARSMTESLTHLTNWRGIAKGIDFMIGLGTKRLYQGNRSRRREEITDHSEALIQNPNLLLDFPLQLQYNPIKIS
jgi:hypothetical protein